ncbi:hypothetical protein GAO09_06515 [Rhizobiales bacterium RZME27]|uniref:Uncharacterized protein n=1 Tax=Endobacterium cereale TaxID=2663029 RepID=A0A6A8A3Z5_9HYPH|nr:hypothetical protein [Endobacterium cereale]MEB2846277.1 hypothetical protein [Endobacterium cereale]MQY45713.1 hypothetical protein [Endobacterium cereale]
MFELPEFTASCDEAKAGIIATFAERAELALALQQRRRDLAYRNPRMAEREVSHRALVEIISELRDAFPPQEVTLYTDLGDDEPLIDTVPSADKVRSRRLLAELLEPPATMAARRAIREARADASVTRAHGQILETLLFGVE